MRAAKPSDTTTLPLPRPPGIGDNHPPKAVSPPKPFDGRLGVSIEEAARALDQHTDSIYRMIGDGRLVASKMGRRTIVHVASILRLLAETVVAPRRRVRRNTVPKPAAAPPAAQPARQPHHRAGKAVQVLQTASAATP